MNIITQILLPLVLAFIMFSMGLDLTTNDFKRITKFPKAFIIGMLLQFISLPLVAFGLSHLFISYGLDPQYAVGLVIIAACPGGVTSNMMTHIAKGDSALSVSLTAVSSVLSVLTLPFIVNFALTTFIPDAAQATLPIGKTIIGIFLITTVPVVIGMFIKSKFSELTKKLEPICRKVASIAFVIIIGAAIAKDWKLLADNFSTLGPVTLALNTTAMLIAFVSAKFANLNQSQTTAITYECGFQNGTLAIFITVTLMNNPMMMLPGGVYSILMFGSAFLYYLMVKKSFQTQSLSEPV